jgi:hypothetical protein
MPRSEFKDYKKKLEAEFLSTVLILASTMNSVLEEMYMSYCIIKWTPNM